MKIRLLFLATVLLPFGLAAQDPISVNDPVLERLDALSQLPWLKNDPFTTDVGKLNTHNFAPDVVPTYSPEVFQQRMLELDERTPFKLTYNKQVQAYIDMYAERKRDQLSLIHI